MTADDRIAAIESRNARVEVDKAWETSLTRRAVIICITYACACIVFLYVTPAPQWYLAALVPVMGYTLSTLGLPMVRRVWEKRRHNR